MKIGLLRKQQSTRSTYSFLNEETYLKARNTVQIYRSWTQLQFQKYLKSLKRDEQNKILGIIAAVTWRECAESLETFAKYVVTKDEHGQGDLTVRPFPRREEKAYIWDVLDTIQAEQLVAIEKSRQLLATWLVCLFILWCSKFQKNRLWFVQSKKEEDAANLVFNSEWHNARISFMESNLPEGLRSDVFPSYGKMLFRDTGSLIWGVPEGGDQIRSYTASGIFSDEAAFQPEFENAWKAARPSISGGGKMIVVSSARSGAYMKRLLKRA